MGRHRRPEPADQPDDDALWSRYQEAKHDLGADDTRTFEMFFDWWTEATDGPSG